MMKAADREFSTASQVFSIRVNAYGLRDPTEMRTLSREPPYSIDA
jgi:hypothetical protein